jgi:ADP-ribose pyrophosphatase YjhB (NUDIX family)
MVPAVYLILQKEGKILLARRKDTGYMDGNYSLPAGHLEGNEPLIQGMIREATEELGIIVSPTELQFVHVSHETDTGAGERLDFYFTTSIWRGDIVNMEPDKCDDLSWFSPDNLPDNIVPKVRIAINATQQKNYYSEIGWPTQP